MIVSLDASRADDYRRFLAIKALPSYEIRGRTAWFPDEYAAIVGVGRPEPEAVDYRPHPGLFDYQRDISRLAIRRRKRGDAMTAASFAVASALLALAGIAHQAAREVVGALGAWLERRLDG